MTSSAPDVFLSYKAEDRARLQPLVAALEAVGFSVWWDAHIGGGTNWRQDIEEHLDSAKCVIVAWSKRSVGPAGEFVRDEATRAKRIGTYLPIRLDEVEPPLGFGEVQALPLKGWKGDPTDRRYLAVEDAVRSRITGEHVARHPLLHAERRISRRALVAGGVGLGAVAAAGAGGWLLFKPSEANAKRIAVLPFANLSGDPEQAYFADGIAEELRSALSRIGMEVIGRTSSIAVRDQETRAAASKLGVANILTGSVRRSPETIRINAQLVSGKDGVERWARSYDRAPGDVIKIQTDIAANVAQALSIALGQSGRTALALGGTADSVAQDLLLRAREKFLTADDPAAIRAVLALINGALDRDAAYADAHVQKSTVLSFFAGGFPTDPSETARLWNGAEASARRALTLAPKLGSAHIALANVATGRLDFRSALQHTRAALALAPDDPLVLKDASVNLISLGYGAEALEVADRLIALDALSARAHARRAAVLFSLKRYTDAIDAVQRAEVLGPGNSGRTYIAGISWLLLGETEKARTQFAAIPVDDLGRLTGEALADARTGNRARSERAMTRLREVFGVGASYQYAEIYAQLGNKDLAFVELQNAVAAKDPGLVDLRIDPFLDPIRGDPRYAALVRKLNFPS